MRIYCSARKHGVADDDSVHVVEHALVAAQDDEAKCLYLGPDRAGNVMEVVTVMRDDGEEVVIHAMPMRPAYQVLLHNLGDPDA